MFESQFSKEDFDFENRITAPDYQRQDTDIEYSLRPKTLSEYIGQDKVKENLSVYMEAAEKAGRGVGSCAALRTSGFGKNYPFPDHR